MEAHLCIDRVERVNGSCHQWAFPQECILPSPYDVKPDIFHHFAVSEGNIARPFWGIKSSYEIVTGMLRLHLVVVHYAANREFAVKIVGHG